MPRHRLHTGHASFDRRRQVPRLRPLLSQDGHPHGPMGAAWHEQGSGLSLCRRCPHPRPELAGEPEPLLPIRAKSQGRTQFS